MALYLVAVALASISQCPPPLVLEGPEPGETIVLARATGARAKVPAPAGALYLNVPTEDVEAEEFVVVMATRPDATEMAWGLFAPADTFLLVRWDHDGTCQRIPTEVASSVLPGTEVVFRVSAARVHAQRRVVDLPGWNWPYPIGVDLAEELGAGAPPDRAQWLSAFEFFGLLASSPRVKGSASRSQQLQELENHYRTGPTHLLSRFPGPQLLRRWRDWAAQGDQGQAPSYKKQLPAPFASLTSTSTASPDGSAAPAT